MEDSNDLKQIVSDILQSSLGKEKWASVTINARAIAPKRFISK
jgi:hypothetical protein